MITDITPLISVIVPVYNMEAYIARCLESLISQTFQSLEIIIVDDDSKDRSMDIVQQYAAKDERICILRSETNAGVAQARNQGLAAAQGEYTAFIDSDDWLALDYFQLLYARIVEEKADMVKGSLAFAWPDKTEVPPMNESIRKCLQRHVFPGIAYTYAFWNTLYRTEMLRRHDIHFPNLTHGEDMVFLVKALLHAKKFVLDDSALYYYNQRIDSASHKISASYYPSLFKHYEMIADMLLQSTLPRREIIDYWQLAIMQPLLTHHLQLADGENLAFYNQFFSSLKQLFIQNGHAYELYYHYPNPFYRCLIEHTPEEVASLYISRQCRPNFENPAFYNQFFSSLKQLLIQNGHAYELYYHYPNPFYRCLIEHTPEEVASLYISHQCRPNFEESKDVTVRICGIPVFRSKRQGNVVKMRICGISFLKIFYDNQIP